MTQYLVLVRHSQPVVDLKIPAKEWWLSKEGIKRCSTLAERLRPFNLSMIYTSQETKATQTAKFTARRLGISWQAYPNLHEHETGEDAASAGEGTFQARVKALFDHKNELVYGVETGNQAANRFTHALNSLIAKTNQNLCLVTHGRVMCLFLAERCKVDGFVLWNRLGLPAILVMDLEGCTIREFHETID